LPAFNGYCSFTNNPTAKAIPLWNNDVQCKVKQQMCETLWNELMHNLSGILKGGRPIKGIKAKRYDVLFMIFPCGSHKFSKEQLNRIQHKYKKYNEEHGGKLKQILYISRDEPFPHIY
jgi:hypothetical protein